MTITRDIFERYCPSAVMPDDVLFDRIEAYVEQGEKLVMTIMGSCYDSLVDDTPIGRLCLRVACLEAFALAIPHLDLVLTENGFGVVSNQNVAPASMDRVNRLLKQVKDDRDDAVDDLIDALRSDADWASSEALKHFSSLVWNAHRQLPLLGFMDGHRSKLNELRPKINAAEEILMQNISDSQFYALCSAIRLHNEDNMQRQAIHKALVFIGAHLAGDMRQARFHMAKLVEFLEDHLDSFESYAVSSAHQANTFTHYENKKDDPCYFFG